MELWQQSERFCFPDNLWLDAGLRNRQVHDWSQRVPGACQPRGCEVTDGLLFHDSLDRVTDGAETADERFRLGIGADGNGNVGIPREARFRSRGDCQPADQGEGMAAR